MNTKLITQLIQVGALLGLAGLAACGSDNDPVSAGSDSTTDGSGQGSAPAPAPASPPFANGFPSGLATTSTQCRSVRVSKVTNEVIFDTKVFDSSYAVTDGRLQVAAQLDGPGTNYCSVPSRQYVESMLDANQLTYRDDGSILFSSPPASTIWSATVSDDGATHYEWNMVTVGGVHDYQRLIVESSGEFRSCRNYQTGLAYSQVKQCGADLDSVLEAASVHLN